MLAESEENANQGFTGIYPQENQIKATGVQPTETSGFTTGDPSEPKRRGGWGRRGRRKRPRDFNAPKHPLTGYLRFLNDNREKVRADNPQASFSEVTKILANDWSKLSGSDKQHYLELAERDKERYVKELEDYQQTEAYRAFTLRKQQEKKRRAQEYKRLSERNSGYASSGGTLTQLIKTQVMPDRPRENDAPTYDIPIFTDQFLDHNKSRESELRQLKKSNTEYEEQNAILSKHIENLKEAIDKMEQELDQQRSTADSLQEHLDTVSFKLTNTFCQLPLPSTNQVATLDTISDYMNQLHNLVLDSPQDDVFVSSVRGILSQVEYPPPQADLAM